MLKRFFVALIVGLLVMSSQIVAAEYDWKLAPRIVDKATLAKYIEIERRKGHTIFRAVLTDALKTSREEFDNESRDNVIAKKFMNIALVLYVEIYATHLADGTTQMTYQITEYPGTRVANAYLSSDKRTAWLKLTAEEKQLYNVAVGIVDKANKRSSEVEKARYIHDEICRIVYDYKDENERNKTAIGALIDHYAHCQGFTDAFYMLGRMCGLNVVRIDGTFKGEPHAWNFITFSDGKAYCVDVTGTFNSKSSMELLTFETMKPRFSCEWEIIPNLQRT